MGDIRIYRCHPFEKFLTLEIVTITQSSKLFINLNSFQTALNEKQLQIILTTDRTSFLKVFA